MALHHPEHAASIQRVLAIPHKRTERNLVTYLTEPEVNALLEACDQSTWTGRRDHTIFSTGFDVAPLPGCRCGRCVDAPSMSTITRIPQFRLWAFPTLGGLDARSGSGDGSDSVLVSAAASVIVRCMDDPELMRLSNHHASLAPVIEERPGRYLGYFENKFGEQLVFVHDDGQPDATVLLGDVGWEPCRVSDAGGLPDVGDLILNDEERAFVNACWIATAWRREDARSGRHDLPEASAGS